MKKIKFLRRFVLFTTMTTVNPTTRKLTPQPQQYHIESSDQSYPVEEFVESGNSVSFTFAPGCPYQGTANNIEKENVQLLATTGKPDTGCSGCP